MSQFTFADRHNGPDDAQVKAMLAAISVLSVDELINKIVPAQIRLKENLNLPEALSEFDYLTMFSQE
jgi:glycine dehydrogenase